MPPDEGRTLDDLKREHGFFPGSRLAPPRGEVAEQSPVRNYVRDLVLGYNDGVVSVFAVTAALAGANFANHHVLVGGVAAAVGGALSMAAGEYISTKSQSEFYASERAREREHLLKWPHLERQELRESLEKKGLQPPVLDQAVESIASDRDRFLDYMMRDEFGVTDEGERSPLRAAGFVMIAFLLGALFPMVGYGILELPASFYASGVMSLLGLFLAGVVRARASRLPWLPAGVEMVFIGVLAASVSFFIGWWLDVQV